MPTYNKLVRDHIPEIIQSSGKELKKEILNQDRYILELKRKLNEEVDEYQTASTNEEAMEELADVLELMHALSRIHGSSIEEVDKIREEKAAKRGGFDEKIFLIEVED